MTLDEVKALIAAMGASDLAEMEVAKDGWTLRLRRGHAVPSSDAAETADASPRPVQAPRSAPGPADARTDRAASSAAAPSSNEVRAPLFGVVHLGPSPDAPPFVTVGQPIEAGAILCTVEAMKTFNEVRAERAGTVEAVHVATGDEVEAGQPLLRVA